MIQVYFLFFERDNLTSLSSIINGKLYKLSIWFASNSLIQNTDKSHNVLFHRARLQQTIINTNLSNISLKRVNFTKFLSFIIDEKKYLRILGLGCHVGMTYAGAFGYSDDIALVAPSIYRLKEMVNVCEQFAHEYHISFNPSKSKLMSFNLSRPLGTPIFLNGQKVEVVDHDFHVGNYVATDLRDINITKHVCDLYQRSNNVISDFNACDSVTLDALHQTYCMHMYGCELWN